MEKYNEKLKHENFYNNILINNPKPLEYQTEPTIIFFKQYNDNNVDYSLVMPIYNQQDIIIKNITSAIVNTAGNFEYIIILDGCTDHTKKYIIEFFDGRKFKENVVRVIIIELLIPVFETTCDNIGFVISEGKYIIEIQADIELIQYGYNDMLAKPCKIYNDIIGVSGRCAHGFLNQNGIGKLSGLIEYRSNIKLEDMNYIYIYGSCVRGPLLLDNEKLKKCRYLDEQNFVLGDDDHDLFCRAYNQFGYKCGYVSIEFNSPLKDGSTRKEMDKINKYILNERRNRSNGGFLANNRVHTEIEKRELSYEKLL
jgi:glycosyltransferase involved in cell wall biosynthesis